MGDASVPRSAREAPGIVTPERELGAAAGHEASTSASAGAPSPEAELQEARARLGASEQKYGALVRAANDAILIADFETALFVEANPAACRMLGYSEDELRRMCGRMLHPPHIASAVDEVSHDINHRGQAWHPALEMLRKDGTRFWAEVRMAVYEAGGRRLYVTIIRDVSERVAREQELERSYRALQETQARLIQTGRLSAMGQLSAGIAHELNQPITAIQGFAQRLRRLPDHTIGRHDHELDIIVRESRRMARIVDKVRTFGRDAPFQPEPTDPHVPLEDALMLVSAQLRAHGVLVVRSADPDLPQIQADPSKLQQVFLNLVMNARDALGELPEDAERRLEIQVSAEPDRVVYTFEDNGGGIEPDVAARIFDPFFSTKPTGRGTGLGLSIAYAIVAEHGGEIACGRGRDGGARFTVGLPVAHG